MKITAEETARFAGLAEITLTEEQAASYAAELDSILSYISCLDELDTTGITPVTQVLPLANVFRDDIPGATLDRGDALRNAASCADGFFKIPRIL